MILKNIADWMKHLKMSNKKSAYLASLLASTMIDEQDSDVYKLENPYAGLPDVTYKGLSNGGKRSDNLTSKQKRSRAKSKRAKKSRKKNR